MPETTRSRVRVASRRLTSGSASLGLGLGDALDDEAGVSQVDPCGHLDVGVGDGRVLQDAMQAGE